MNRRFTLKFFYGLVLASTLFFKLSAQQVFKTTTTSVIPYLEYLPQDYSTNTNKYPIVFFLHGIGERGPNSTDPTVLDDYIQNVAKHGPPKHVKAGYQFPFILISPQLKNNNSTWPSSYVMEVIEYCRTYLRIDERRIYLTGLSLGGGGTWWTAQDYPEFFAAIAPVCGGYNSTAKACGIANADLPVWAFHGDKDTTVPLSKSQNMVNAINNCVPQTSNLAKLTIYTGVAHNAWDYAYKTDNSLHDPNVFQWLMSFTNTQNNDNKIPVANAGTDKIINVTSTTLTGSATDADGTIASYAWTQMSGPTATVSNASTATLSLSNLSVGEYVFRLRVKDNSGNTDSDYVKLTVEENVNTAPKANAGKDITITLPVNSVVIKGSATDADGTIATYKWTKVRGPVSLTLANATTSSLTTSSLVEGSYVFRLTVTDNKGATHYDDMLVKVNPFVSSVVVPIAPTVTAGADKAINLPTSSTSFTGSATDIDGTVKSYIWTKVSGPACTMTNTTTTTLKVQGLVLGTYVFRLTATDNGGNQGSDEVKLTVNAPPAANAGADKTVMLPLLSTLTLEGKATDIDGSITKYVWSKYSGPNFITERNTSSTPTFKIVQMNEGTYVFKFAVTDNLGATTFDYVTVNAVAATEPTSYLR
ncbi:PKD domain-containing protein [Chryseosolibacter indicus]|uniref:PKD domain-containing protein n=1 Tax=Chryseosolibacter indicus TaxID=2782351 RepID=A0ABS5VW98_9BACT|nr:PHB depolymerase family esterase [Chryseosolibacter indicus]MBT1705705.1 PKD domain-containing protein [Chryseosolibacter indicus]